MSDLIKRSDAIEKIADYFDLIGYSRRFAKILLDKVPSADRPKGEWIGNNLDGTFKVWDCSECGVHMETRWNFCPNCGARMFAKDTNVPNKKGADDERVR